MAIQRGDKIAQLLLLPYISINSSNDVRTSGFGSTDRKQSFWTSLVPEFARPTINIKTKGKRLSGLLDTGSDITLISKHLWPPILACTKNFLPNCRDFSNQSTRGLSEYSNLSMLGTRRTTCNIKTLYDRCTPLSNRKTFTYAMANSDIHSTFFRGATAHLTNNTIIKTTQKNDEPIWIEQWPLRKEK